ncbi:hypothetical protein F5Y19DRAFT_195006 [Xylariaceae sp. FL1651]|nr:hypothetical protein F5Y19DRAFT_195006 [Xylariaceae sp. FL1651]
MSQREPTGPSVSPRTSTSSPAGTSISTDSYQTGLRGGGDRQAENRLLESAGILRSNGENVQQSFLSRGLGVHTILNPTDIQPPPTTGRHDGSALGSHAPNATSSSSPHVHPHFVFPGHGVGRQEQTTPTHEYPPSTAPPSADRGSPGTSRPFPAIAAARRTLTPRSPRSMSLGQANSFRSSSHPQPQHLAVGSQDPSRVIASESGIPSRLDQPVSARGSPLAQQFNRTEGPVSRPPPNLAPLATSTRSISQPIQTQASPNTQGDPYYSPGPGVQPRQHPGYPQNNPYPTGLPPSHSGFPSNHSGTDHRWSGGHESALQYGSNSVRNLAFGEGQAALRIQPAHGEEFIVPVDTHQGSRQADEKRQRNAGASARFRKRKKDREMQERLEHQRLENRNRELERRIQGLEVDQERLRSDYDRVRSDRDRLRDIVYRTPTVSELAYQGPPSPDSTRSGGSFAERNSHGSGPPPPPPVPMAYGAADPATGERSSQRRRTDPHPQVEFSNASYGSAPTSLPPIPAPGYTTSISQPGTPSTGHHPPRLPPLRLDPATGTPTTAASNASTPVQAYPQMKREPYETGWATGPRGPTDPGQR